MSELSPDEQLRWEALARYLAGESPAEEAAEVRAWLAEDPARGDLLAALDATADRLAFRAPAELDVEGALRRVRTRIAEPEVIPLRPRPQRRSVWQGAGLRAAAAVLLVVGGALLFWRLLGSGGRPAPGAARSYATAVGERDSVSLPDGSRVLLGPASRLVVAAGYGSPDRTVELEGEALFEVRHDDAHPFAVRAGPAVVRDVGTRFAVRSDTGRAQVVVTSGAVRLGAVKEADGLGVVLRPGDRGELAGGRATAQRAAATEDDLAWTRGRLVFHDAPLARVATDLRRWYGIELRVDHSLAGRHLTASFQGEPAERVVSVVALALGAQLEMRGDTAVLHGGRP